MGPIRRKSSHGGFTLVEMMVAVVIASLFIGWSYAAYIVHQKTFTTENQITEMQYTGGTAIDLIKRDIRESSFGVPESPSITFASTTYTTSLAFNDSGTDSGPDTITLLGAFRKIGELSADVNPAALTINVTWDADFDPGTMGLSYLSIDGLDYLAVSSITGTAITVSNPVTAFHPTNRPVFAVDAVTYFVNGNVLYRGIFSSTSTDINGDGLGDDPIAYNIDDLQFEQLDVSGATTTDPANTQRIRVSILARTERAVQNELDPTAASITLENNTTTANDFFRRRIYRAEISLRNPVRF